MCRVEGWIIWAKTITALNEVVVGLRVGVGVGVAGGNYVQQSCRNKEKASICIHGKCRKNSRASNVFCSKKLKAAVKMIFLRFSSQKVRKETATELQKPLMKTKGTPSQ